MGVKNVESTFFAHILNHTREGAKTPYATTDGERKFQLHQLQKQAQVQQVQQQAQQQVQQ